MLPLREVEAQPVAMTMGCWAVSLAELREYPVALSLITRKRGKETRRDGHYMARHKEVLPLVSVRVIGGGRDLRQRSRRRPSYRRNRRIPATSANGAITRASPARIGRWLK